MSIADDPTTASKIVSSRAVPVGDNFVAFPICNSGFVIVWDHLLVAHTTLMHVIVLRDLRFATIYDGATSYVLIYFILIYLLILWDVLAYYVYQF